MVRSKDVARKPKDPPFLTPPRKSGGGGFLDEGRPRNRGGAAMSPSLAPAPASVPNYMRATSSSDAKGGRRARLSLTLASASASPSSRRRPAVRVVARGKVLFPELSPSSASGAGLVRATCSSTLKGAKFPAALDLALGATDAAGPAAMRVCPYTYCSLNGHAHSPAVPLRSFLASRRRLIKTQQSMKLRGVSAFRKKPGDKTGGSAAKVAPLIDEEAVGDFFVEVYAGPRVSTDMSCSDMSVDEMDATVRKMEFLVFDRCGAEDEDGETGKDLSVCGDGGERDEKLEEKRGAYRDCSPACSDAAESSGEFVEELPWIRYHGYEDDSLDDGISEEQRIRDDEVEGAEISAGQEGDSEEGTSGRLDDACEEEAAEEQEANDEENISNLIQESDIDTEQEGVGCRVEACQELDRRDEDNILDTVCHGEPPAGRRTAEEKLSDDVYESEIPDQEVAGSVDESCEEDISVDREAKDECSVESDRAFSEEEQDVKDEEDMSDDGSEMEISEEAISGDGCVEDFSDEVTSRAVPEDGSIANSLFEQYVSTADDVFEQDVSPSNGQSNGQEELCVTGIKLGADSEETVVAQPIDQEDTVDGMEDSRKESETATYRLEQSSEESGITQESNPMSTDGTQMEPEIATCDSMDAPEESGITQESRLDDDAEYVTDAADMGPETTRCKLEDASEESCFDQETVEADDSACVSEETGIGHDTVEGDDSAYVTDDAQNDSEISKCKSEDVSKESITSQDSENSSSDAQNESEPTASELAVVAGSEDTEIESKLTTCKSEDVSEETIIAQEADHDDSFAYVNEGAQNESAVTTYESDGAQEESVVVKEDEEKDNSSVDAQNKPETAACESVGSSEKTAVSHESDGHGNSTDDSDSAQKDVTMPSLVACEDTHVTEEINQSFNLQIPEHKYDCGAEDHVETQNIPAEQTDVKEPSIDDICDAFSGLNLKGDVYFDPSESDTCLRNKLIISRRRRTPEEEEYMRGFNPRAPNFLPLELDPDAEKVDLKHQMVDDRKNAEEWMIDYALRRAVTNLAPARKKKVELLVQAFETVLPHDEENKKSMTPPRPVQACN